MGEKKEDQIEKNTASKEDTNNEADSKKTRKVTKRKKENELRDEKLWDIAQTMRKMLGLEEYHEAVSKAETGEKLNRDAEKLSKELLSKLSKDDKEKYEKYKKLRAEFLTTIKDNPLMQGAVDVLSKRYYTVLRTEGTPHDGHAFWEDENMVAYVGYEHIQNILMEYLLLNFEYKILVKWDIRKSKSFSTYQKLNIVVPCVQSILKKRTEDICGYTMSMEDYEQVVSFKKQENEFYAKTGCQPAKQDMMEFTVGRGKNRKKIKDMKEPERILNKIMTLSSKRTRLDEPINSSSGDYADKEMDRQESIDINSLSADQQEQMFGGGMITTQKQPSPTMGRKKMNR